MHKCTSAAPLLCELFWFCHHKRRKILLYYTHILTRALGAVIFKPLFKCFIHTLRDVNPGEAARVEAAQPQRGRRDSLWRGDAAQRPQPQPHFELHLSGPYRVRLCLGACMPAYSPASSTMLSATMVGHPVQVLVHPCIFPTETLCEAPDWGASLDYGR